LASAADTEGAANNTIIARILRNFMFALLGLGLKVLPFAALTIDQGWLQTSRNSHSSSLRRLTRLDYLDKGQGWVFRGLRILACVGLRIFCA
jgi:hypothetical protein